MGLKHFCSNERRSGGQSEKLPEFPISCPNVADLCPAKGAAALCHPLSYAFDHV